MRIGRLITAVLITAASVPAAQGFTFKAAYANPDVWTPEQQAIVTEAMNDWTIAVTANTAPSQKVTINFYQVNTGTGTYLGQWQFGGQIPTFAPYSSGLVHNVYVNTAYFDQMSFSPDAPSADQYDFLTVIRHELGHALGFTDRLYLDNGVDRWTSHIVDSTFDPNGLNIPMRVDGTHVNLPGDLMYFQLPKGVRKDISATDVGMLSLAYGYVPVPEPASLAVFGMGAMALLRRRRAGRR